MKRLVVFASGRGSNAQALYEAMQRGEIQGEIVAVVSDKPKAKVLERAKRWNVPTHVIEPKNFASKDEFEQKLLDEIKDYEADGIVLAGFMRLLGERFISAYEHRILNIHPALLPSFPGLHAQAQAVEAGVKISGCTVHFVDCGMDTGPIIMQSAVPVYASDDADSLAARILTKEHPTYIAALKLFCEGRLKITGNLVSIVEE